MRWTVLQRHLDVSPTITDTMTQTMTETLTETLQAARSKMSVCGLCSRWCEVSDDVSLEELRERLETRVEAEYAKPPVTYTYPLPRKHAVEFPAVRCRFTLSLSLSLFKFENDDEYVCMVDDVQ